MSIGLATFGDCDPCCGSGCPICSDPFDRADSDDISTGSDCGWTEDAGDGDIVSNQVRITTSFTALKCNTGHPQSESSSRITATVNGSAAGNCARILVAYLDDDNYYAGEIKFGSGGTGHVKALKRLAGVETNLSTVAGTIPAGTPVNCECCVTASGSVQISAGSLRAAGVDTAMPARAHGGLGSGTIVSGNVEFDDFIMDRTDDECPRCYDCGACAVGEIPDAIRVVIGGIALGGSSPCADCLDLNATYDCPYLVVIPSTDACLYRYTLPTTICDVSRIEVEIRDQLGSPRPVVSLKNSTSTVTYLQFGNNLSGEETACNSWEDLSIARTSNASTRCGWSGGTCEITSL